MKDITLEALLAAMIELEAIEDKTECQKDALFLIKNSLKEERNA